MRIGLDIDDVLVPLVEGLDLFYNTRYGKEISLRDHTSYDLSSVWGISPQETVQIVEDFYRSPAFSDLKPLEGAQDGVGRLSKNHTLIAVSSRPKLIQGPTEEWIGKYFSNNISEVICTGQYNLDSNQISKDTIFLREGVDIVVEDVLPTAVKCVDHGMTAFLFNMPWNQNGNLKNERLVRVHNWADLMRKLK